MKSTNILTETLESLNESKSDRQPLTVNMETMGVLMNNLTNLYSDPKLGAFRETLSNAIDSHVGLAGNTDAYIQVTLPNIRENGSTITISDYGVGMNRETILGNFLSYGNSTKTEDNTQTGRFGYGCKAPLAVADKLEVVSVKDGMKNSFGVYKDLESTEVAPSFEWSEECKNGPVPTTEPNGVSVSYHVPRVVNEGIASDWFPNDLALLGVPFNTVKINGNIVAKTVHNSALFESYKVGDSIVGWVAKDSEIKISGITKNYRNNIVLVHIGNIVYKITNPSNSIEALKSWGQTIVLNAPIGTLDMTPARDDLRYTSRTVETLESIAEDFIKAVHAQLQIQVNRIDSPFSAAHLVSEYQSAGFPFSEEYLTPVTYRNHGDILEGILSLKNKLPTSESVDGKIVKYRTRVTRARNMSDAFRYAGGVSTINMYSMIEKHGAYIVPEASPSNYGRFRRNLDLLKRFGNANDVSDALETVLIAEGFLEADKWAKLFFSGFPKLEDELAAARKARAEYNKAHGVTPTPRSETQRVRTPKAAFLVVSPKEGDEERYTVEAYENLDDLKDLGPFIKEVAPDHTPLVFSASNYVPVADGLITKLPSRTMLALLYAVEHNMKLVIRTVRQNPLSFDNDAKISYREIQEWSNSKVIQPPILSVEEIIARFVKPTSFTEGTIYSSSLNRAMNRLFHHREDSVSQFTDSLTQAGIVKLVEFCQEENLEAPESLSAFSRALKMSQEEIESFPGWSWANEAVKEYHTRNRYVYGTLSLSDYSEDNVESLNEFSEIFEDVRKKFTLAFHAFNLMNKPEMEEEIPYLKAQLKAIISASD